MSDDVVIREDELVELPAVPTGAPERQPGAPIVPQLVKEWPAIWYTSNSPRDRGQKDCATRRFGEYHAGPHGTGYRRRASAIPLATGKAIHYGLQLIGEWVLEWQNGNPNQQLQGGPALDEVVAWAAGEAAGRYEATARARGLQLTVRDSKLPEHLELLVMEQRTLIEALVWVYALVRLPYMLSKYRLISVEFEEAPVLDCSCGLCEWVGQDTDHAARGCLGIGAQGKADYLWQGVAPDVRGAVTYEEFKSKAMRKKSWEDAFEHSYQLWMNMEAASRRLGIPVNSAFVTALYKGKRERPWKAPDTVPKTQQSPLVYGWFDPGNLPMRAPSWASAYKWTDDDGRGHTLPQTFLRTAVWDDRYPLDLLRGGAASRVESWVRSYITPAQLVDLVGVYGPFPRPEHRLGDAVAAIKAEERRWREVVSFLRENQALEIGHPLVTEWIPRSWNCTGWDGTRCEFYPVCMKEPGHENMATMGIYEIRTPHHAPERAAFEAQGIVFPGEDEEEDGDE